MVKCTCDEKKDYQCHGCTMSFCRQCVEIQDWHPFTGEVLFNTSFKWCNKCRDLCQPFAIEVMEMHERHAAEIDEVWMRWRLACQEVQS